MRYQQPALTWRQNNCKVIAKFHPYLCAKSRPWKSKYLRYFRRYNLLWKTGQILKRATFDLGLRSVATEFCLWNESGLLPWTTEKWIKITLFHNNHAQKIYMIIRHAIWSFCWPNKPSSFCVAFYSFVTMRFRNLIVVWILQSNCSTFIEERTTEHLTRFKNLKLKWIKWK